MSTKTAAPPSAASTRQIPPVLEPAQVAGLQEKDPGFRLLDVRTPGEYESVHIRGAYNVPLDRLKEHAEEIRSALEHPVVLICRSGARARQAVELLESTGLTKVHLMDGGLNAWMESGRPVERGAQRISLERQVRIAAGGLAALGGVLALTVSPLWAILPTFVGAGLVFAGVTDTCGMAMVLSRLPYNRSASCDVERMVQSLCQGSSPAGNDTSDSQRRISCS